MAAVGQVATAAFDEEDIVNLRTERQFRAKVVPLGDLELIGEGLGKDIREHVKIHTRNSAAAAEILPNEVLSMLGEKFKVLTDSRSNNPATLHIEFECVKLTAKDAS